MTSSEVAFRSRQFAFEQPIVSITMGGCVVAMIVVAALTDQSQGEWLAILVGGVFLVALCFAVLTISVTADEVVVRFAGVLRASIPLSDVARADARSYQPLKQFGGWGWRFGRNGARQYAMAGKRAAVITRVDGREVYLGARDIDGLVSAIQAARSGDTPPR